MLCRAAFATMDEEDAVGDAREQYLLEKLRVHFPGACVVLACVALHLPLATAGLVCTGASSCTRAADAQCKAALQATNRLLCCADLGARSGVNFLEQARHSKGISRSWRADFDNEL